MLVPRVLLAAPAGPVFLSAWGPDKRPPAGRRQGISPRLRYSVATLIESVLFTWGRLSCVRNTGHELPVSETILNTVRRLKKARASAGPERLRLLRMAGAVAAGLAAQAELARGDPWLRSAGRARSVPCSSYWLRFS